jgi:AAA+ superfamily predicted ATPase
MAEPEWSAEHLWDELRRVDQLVRAQTVRWKQTIAETKPDRLWGMVHVSTQEVDAYLAGEFEPPGTLPPELEVTVGPYREEVERRDGAIAERHGPTPRSRLGRLRELFGLSDLDRDILLVCLLPQLDERYRRLFGFLQDDASRWSPSVGLVAQILSPLATQAEVADRLAPAAPLRRHELVVGADDPRVAEPLPIRPLRVDDRIAAYVLGTDAPDVRLGEVAEEPVDPVRRDELAVEPDLLERLEALTGWARDDPGRTATLLFHGGYGSGRVAAARTLSEEAGHPLLVFDVGRARRARDGWPRVVELAFREASLAEAWIAWRGCEALLERGEQPHDWHALLAAAEAFDGLVFLVSDLVAEPGGRHHSRPFIRLDFRPPSYRLRFRIWRERLPAAEEFEEPPDRDGLADVLANGFQLTDGQIGDAVAAARALALARDPQAARLVPDDLFEGCRRQSSRGLESFTRRIEPRTELTFDDLVLPPVNERQLRELRDRIRYRNRVYSTFGFERRLPLGKGLVAMFTGTTGTGKTMAAELLAREQGVDLYKVDLSSVVSKYVGETEKNLATVFSEAEDANAIIFFDEADALFGKRGEVKDARDRWANIEINYLLQRVEEYAGVVILASNLRQNIDEAFMRRIHVVVDFPFPGPEARSRIWRGMFPRELGRPPDDDLELLANRFELSGGSTKNVVVDAAFRALAESEGGAPEVTLRHLVLGIAREYQKLGRPITRGEFSEELYGWVEQELLYAAPAG